MHRRYAMSFHKKQKEFVNCVNMVERIKKAKALPSGMKYLNSNRIVIKDSGLKKYFVK